MCKKKNTKLEALKTDFECSAKEQYVKSFDGSEIRVLTFDKVQNPAESIEIMFIPGLLTVFSRWEKVVRELNEQYVVHYIESREKISSRLKKRASMKIEEMRKDLEYSERVLGLDKKQYITISSSMGGALILENLAVQSLKPIGNIFISPAVELIFPKWVPRALQILPPFAVTFSKPFILWLLKRRTLDPKREPEQAKFYIRSVKEADAKKMRKCLIKNANRYNGWELLPKISDRIILIGASTDKAHKRDFSINVAHALSNCSYVDLGTNKAAHDTPLVNLTKEFTLELSSKGPKVMEKKSIHIN